MAALDGNDFSLTLDAAQAGDAGAARGNIVSTRHFQAGLIFAVPVGDADGQSYVNTLGYALQRLIEKVFWHGCVSFKSTA